MTAAKAPGRAKADLALLGITALWGGTFVVVKDSLASASPLIFLALRFGIGAVGAAVLARRTLLDRTSIRSGLVLGVFLFLGFALQTFGLESTTPSRSAFITGLTVVLVPFVSILLFRRWPRIPSLIGVALAVLGMYWLTLGSAPAQQIPTLRGDLLTLGCTVAYAFHVALTETLSRSAKVMAMVAVELAVVSVLSAICAPFASPHLEWSGSFAFAVVFTGLFASTLAIGLQTWGQARTTAVRAALIFSLEPVFAALYSVVMGRETLGWPEVVGGSAIIAGVLVSEVGNALWSDRREPARLL